MKTIDKIVNLYEKAFKDGVVIGVLRVVNFLAAIAFVGFFIISGYLFFIYDSTTSGLEDLFYLFYLVVYFIVVSAVYILTVVLKDILIKIKKR